MRAARIDVLTGPCVLGACAHPHACRRLQQQLTKVDAQMAELRTKLYARLGDSINLDVPASAAASKA